MHTAVIFILTVFFRWHILRHKDNVKSLASTHFESARAQSLNVSLRLLLSVFIFTGKFRKSDASWSCLGIVVFIDSTIRLTGSLPTARHVTPCVDYYGVHEITLKTLDHWCHSLLSPGWCQLYVTLANKHFCKFCRVHLKGSFLSVVPGQMNEQSSFPICNTDNTIKDR